MDPVEQYRLLIYEIVTRTGMPDSLLHVHAGLFIFFLVQFASRRPLGSPVPFVAVCIAAVANEVMDRLAFDSWRLHDTPWDLLNTLIWPFVLMLCFRYVRPRKEGVQP